MVRSANCLGPDIDRCEWSCWLVRQLVTINKFIRVGSWRTNTIAAGHA